MTQDQARNILKNDYQVKSIIKSKNRPTKTLAKLLNVDQATINAWYTGIKKPSPDQFQRLYNLPESRALGLKRQEELLNCAFRHQHVPMDVLNGIDTDPEVLYYYGL